MEPKHDARSEAKEAAEEPVTVRPDSQRIPPLTKEEQAAVRVTEAQVRRAATESTARPAPDHDLPSARPGAKPDHSLPEPPEAKPKR